MIMQQFHYNQFAVERILLDVYLKYRIELFPNSKRGFENTIISLTSIILFSLEWPIDRIHLPIYLIPKRRGEVSRS